MNKKILIKNIPRSIYVKTIKHLLENTETGNITDPLVKEVTVSAMIDSDFYEKLFSYKPQLKTVNITRAEDIIKSSNPNMEKYYYLDRNIIEFWISENPYRKYVIHSDGSSEQKVAMMSYLTELLNNNGFKQMDYNGFVYLKSKLN